MRVAIEQIDDIFQAFKRSPERLDKTVHVYPPLDRVVIALESCVMGSMAEPFVDENDTGTGLEFCLFYLSEHRRFFEHTIAREHEVLYLRFPEGDDWLGGASVA